MNVRLLQRVPLNRQNEQKDTTMDLSKVFLYIPGIIIFLVGSGQRRRPGLFGGRGCVPASGVRCDHVVKKDRRDRDVYNYYNILAEFTDPATGKRVKRTVKSPTEYYVAQEIWLQNINGPGEARAFNAEEETLFPPLAQMIGGALLILLAYWENNGDEVRAMACLSLVLTGAGILLIIRYIAAKRRNLEALDAEIVEIYARQLSRETKILMSSKYTYYPVVRYRLDGQENLRRCNINSSNEKSFKVGEHMTLYYDKDKHAVTESNAKIGMLIAGILILGLGIAAFAALFAAVLS